MRILNPTFATAAGLSILCALPAAAEEPGNQGPCFELDLRGDWDHNNGDPEPSLRKTGEMDVFCNEALVLSVGRNSALDQTTASKNFALLAFDLPPEHGLDLGSGFTLLAEAFAGVAKKANDPHIYEGGAALPLRLSWNQHYAEIKPGFLYLKESGQEGSPAAALTGVFGWNSDHYGSFEIEAGLIRFVKENDTFGLVVWEGNIPLAKLGDGLNLYAALDGEVLKRFSRDRGHAYNFKPGIGLKIKDCMFGLIEKCKTEIGPRFHGNQKKRSWAAGFRLTFGF